MKSLYERYAESKGEEDGERELVEHDYQYLAQNRYPGGCDKNHKRIIWKKSQLVKDGVLYTKCRKTERYANINAI